MRTTRFLVTTLMAIFGIAAATTAAAAETPQVESAAPPATPPPRLATHPDPRPRIGAQLDPSSGADGVRVLAVLPGGPAASSGLRRGDVIIAIEGDALTGKDDPAGVLREQLATAEADKPVRLRILRDGDTRELSVKPQVGLPAIAGVMTGVPWSPGVPHRPGRPGMPGQPLPPMLASYPAALGGAYFAGPHAGRFAHEPFAAAFGGLELVTLSPKLGEYFDAKSGVLVASVAPDSPYQLEDGDVLLAIDGREPTSGPHAMRILASYEPDEEMELSVLRRGKRVTLK